MGDVDAARAVLRDASEPRQMLLLEGTALHARHHLDLGDLLAARVLVDDGIEKARKSMANEVLPWFLGLLARIDLAHGLDPTVHLDEIRGWTARSSDMQWIIETHLLQARDFLGRGDTPTALAEAETGLLHAVACGYGLLRIELLVTLARIRLAWPDPPKAIQSAREALDLATHPDCQYAWGEADAAQVWGEAYFANHEPALAHRAFTQALAVRNRIEHPGVAETEKWLGMTGT
jgi:hypothetical protein